MYERREIGFSPDRDVSSDPCSDSPMSTGRSDCHGTTDRVRRTFVRVLLATVAFLVFFYSTTLAISLMYALDRAPLRF